MLNGKVAVVTGASRGIGRQIAISMAKEGAVVIVNYNGSAAKAEEVVKEITEAGGQAEAVQCNVSDYSAAEAFLKDIISRYKRIDILVNNAGITRDNLILRLTEQDFDAVLDTNLKSAFLCCKEAARRMVRQRYGRIVNLSSVVALRGNAGQTNYAASKAGVVGMTKSLAKELASRGVTVNAVAPGFIETDMTAAMPQAAKDAMMPTIPMQRLGAPEDVAKAVAFLASDEAAYVTGQVLAVDGGMAM